MLKHPDVPLGHQVTFAFRQLAAIAERWIVTGPPSASCAGMWWGAEMLVVVARGKRAADIAAVLEAENLLIPQRDEDAFVPRAVQAGALGSEETSPHKEMRP